MAYIPSQKQIDVLQGILEALEELTFLGNAKGLNADLRVVLTPASIVNLINTVATINTLTTCNTVQIVNQITNQTQLGAIAANQLVSAHQNSVAILSNYQNVLIT